MVKNLINYDSLSLSLSLSAYMYVLHCFYSVMWGGGGVTSQIFVPLYNSERTSFRPIFIILTKFSIQIYIFEPKMQDLRSIFIILANITHPYLEPII